MYMLNHNEVMPILEDPGITNFNTTQVAAIDSDTTNDLIYPYAHTASPANDRTSRVFTINAAAASLTALKRFAFGSFIGAENNEDGNIALACVGSMSLTLTNTGDRMDVTPIIGRSNLSFIVSSLTTQENLLNHWMPLPCEKSNGDKNITVKVQTGVIDILKTDGYIYFFGFMISNYNASSAVDLEMNAYTSLYKDTYGINLARPVGLG